LLAEVSEEQADRLRYIDAARTVAEKRGGSSAPWDLSELAVAMEYGDNEAFQRLLTHINEEHLREPGIGEALMSLLGRAGLIGPATPEGMAVAVGDPALAGAAAPSASAAPQIWTPGGQTAPAAGGKKPAIWTPGS
jgi:hypothetical protein